jgi:hypothetical protein
VQTSPRRLNLVTLAGAAAAWLVLAPVHARADEREQTEVVRTAIDDLRRSRALYGNVVNSLGHKPPFSWVDRQKEKMEAKLLKLAAKLSIDVPPPLWKAEDVPTPKDRDEACSFAVTQELRNVAIAERALEAFDGGKGRRMFKRIHRRTRHKHLRAFERCIEH